MIRSSVAYCRWRRVNERSKTAIEESGRAHSGATGRSVGGSDPGRALTTLTTAHRQGEELVITCPRPGHIASRLLEERHVHCGVLDESEPPRLSELGLCHS